MKSVRPLLVGLLVIMSVSFLLSSAARAQKDLQLPPELNQTSSLSEILTWLDKNSFARARIGLNLWRYSSSPLSRANRRVHESAVLSQGFKLVKADGCYLTLRNADVKLLSYGTSAYPSEWHSLDIFSTRRTDPTSYPAELYIRLNRMSYKKGKAPYLHTKNPDEAKLFGSWRTEFKDKGGWSREAALFLVVLDLPPGAGQDFMYGDSIVFTFDSKDLSEQFNAAFRQAIKLCTK